MKIEDIDGIKQYEQNTDARLRSFNTMRESLKKIQGHISCPTCMRDFTTIEKIEMNRIKVALDAEINRAMTERDELARANAPAVAQARQERDARDQKERADRAAYISAHEKQFAALLKKYRANPQGFVLPAIPESERAAWNEAIDWWSMMSDTRRDMEGDIDVFKC